MKQLMKKGISALLVLMLVVSMLPAICLTADAATVTYRYGSNGYIYNWGVRETEATFLSPNAEKFYQKYNVTYESLAALSGSSSTSSVPNSALYKKLYSIMDSAQTWVTSYNDTRSLYKYTDCQNNADKISSFYSGTPIGPDWDGGDTWNREHTWPNSKSDSGSNENDIMMLRPTSVSENSSRGNKAYGQSGSYYNPNSQSGGKYDLRGDVARIVLFVYVRWGGDYSNLHNNMWGSSGVIESKDVLLSWMQQDPVDTWELGRNDSVESMTGTRNVFVDYPELAFELFEAPVPNMQTPSGKASGASAAIEITSQPVSQGVTVGSNANFTVTANGTGLTYQWQWRASAAKSWAASPLASATTATLTVPGTTSRNGYQYRCAITDSSGITVYTDVVTLSIVDSLVITAQPVDVQVTEGETAYFTVAATGTGITYQWQYRTGESGSWLGSPATGNKTATLTIPGTLWRSGYQYRCVITDSSGNTLYTDTVTLTVGEKITLNGWNLTLQDDIGVNFSFSMTAQQAAEAVIGITVDGVTTEISVADIPADESGNYMISTNVAAAQMGESIRLTVNGVEQDQEYSVRGYADYILDEANGYDEVTRAMVTQMLHYGAAAQTLFDYGTDNMVNDGYDDTVSNEIPEAGQTPLIAGSAEGISFYAASMVYRSRIAMRYYFRVEENVENYVFRAGGNLYTPVEKDGMYYVEIPGICPADLDEAVTLTVADAEERILTVTYGPMDYIARQYHKGQNEDLGDLLQQLYDYYIAAEAFVAQ